MKIITAAAAAFSGNWESAADVIADFEINPDALAGAYIIAAHYETGNWEGSAFLLFAKDGNLYEVHGSHCSCYGLEGQWDPEIVTPESLIHRAKASIGRRPMYDAAEKVLAYLAADDPYAALSQHLHGDGGVHNRVCSTYECEERPVARYERGGVGSYYCADCAAALDFPDVTGPIVETRA